MDTAFASSRPGSAAADSRGPGAMLGAIGVATILAVLVPAALWLNSPGVEGNIASGLAVLLAAFAGVRLAHLIRSGDMRILELVFYVYVYVWLGLTAMLQAASKRYPWPGTYSEEKAIAVVLLVWVGVIAYEIGLRLRGTTQFGSFGERLLTRTVRPERVLVLGGVALVLALMLLRKLGGATAILVSRVEFQDAFRLVGGGQTKALGMLIHLGLSVPAFAALLLTWALWIERKRLPRRTRLWAGLGLVVVIAINAIVNNPFYSARAWFGTILLSLAFTALEWRRWTGALWTGGLLLLFLVLFPYSDVFRQATDVSVDVKLGAAVPAQLVKSGDYASFQQLLNAERYVEKEGFAAGRQMLGTLFVWIPRRAWRSKPLDTADMVATHARYSYTNLEMPLWGELFVDAGILGVAIGFLLYGWCSALLQRVMRARRNSRLEFGTLLIASLVGYQLMILRGDLMSNFLWWLVMAGLVFLGTGPADSMPRRSVGGARATS